MQKCFKSIVHLAPPWTTRGDVEPGRLLCQNISIKQDIHGYTQNMWKKFNIDTKCATNRTPNLWASHASIGIEYFLLYAYFVKRMV